MTKQKKSSTTLLGRWLYIKKYIKDFTTLGSVAPSSSKASKFLASQIKRNGGYVIELGPGSGTVTQAILDSGIGFDKLIAIEIDKHFYDYMKAKFPKLNILNASATDLKKLLPKHVIGNVSTIISTIPMKNLHHNLRNEIINAAFSVMRPDGNFVQIRYSTQSPIKAKQLGLKQLTYGRVWWNIPPMTTFGYEKEAAKVVKKKWWRVQ